MVELWFLYVISAVLVWGITSIVDKIILTKYLNPFSYSLLYLPSTLVVVAGIFLFVPINFNPVIFSLAALAGAISVIGYYLYAFAMKKEEASRIVALTNIYPVFVAILAAFFINEIFSIKTYVGISLIIFGAVLISYKRNAFKKIIPAALLLIVIAANFSFGIEQTISKITLNFYSFWQFFAIFSLGKIFAIILSFGIPSFRKSFVREIKHLKRSIFLMLMLSTSVWLLGSIFFYYAVSLGPITLVSTISILAPFVTLMLAVFLSKFLPKILREEIDPITIALKIMAVFLIIFGTYVITI